MRLLKSIDVAILCLGILVAAGLFYWREMRRYEPPPHESPTTVHDTSALKPPAGAHVAIVEFEDMECPDCAASNPILKRASSQFGIPWIRHDFPLSYHKWSFQAAVNARWFDTRSRQLGDEYRDSVFASQRTLVTLDDLNSYTGRFAAGHAITLAPVLDPQGKLAADVKADHDVGDRTGIMHTPTVWIVIDHGKGSSYREVSTDLHDLNSIIGQAMADSR